MWACGVSLTTVRTADGRGKRLNPYIPLLLTVPGVGPLLAYTIASEIGDIARFASPKKLTRYTGLCPIVRQSGNRDFRGPLAKNGTTATSRPRGIPSPWRRSRARSPGPTRC